MNRKIKYSLLLLLTAIFVFSCRDDEEMPSTPLIRFMDFHAVFNKELGIYDRGVIVFSYEDGDGDIGLTSADTVPPYEYNLLVDYYEKQNGKWEKVFLRWFNNETQQWDTLSLNGRIPVLTPSGNYKGIKGEIYDTVFIYNYNSPFDTIKFELSILDRALQQSNVIKTPAIVVPRISAGN